LTAFLLQITQFQQMIQIAIHPASGDDTGGKCGQMGLKCLFSTGGKADLASLARAFGIAGGGTGQYTFLFGM
jgi:hypothetical protein